MNANNIRIVTKRISRAEIQQHAEQGFGDMVKAVVDLERGVMAMGGELHADMEALLLEQESRQEHLWGINLYPDVKDASWIECDSLINIRPAQGNRSRHIENPETQRRTVELVTRMVV